MESKMRLAEKLDKKIQNKKQKLSAALKREDSRDAKRIRKSITKLEKRKSRVVQSAKKTAARLRTGQCSTRRQLCCMYVWVCGVLQREPMRRKSRPANAKWRATRPLSSPPRRNWRRPVAAAIKPLSAN